MLRSPPGDFSFWILDGITLRVGVVVSEHRRALEISVLASSWATSSICAATWRHHGAHIVHQPLRIAQVAPADGLRHDDKDIVDLVVEVSRSQLPRPEVWDKRIFTTGTKTWSKTRPEHRALDTGATEKHGHKAGKSGTRKPQLRTANGALTYTMCRPEGLRQFKSPGPTVVGRAAPKSL